MADEQEAVKTSRFPPAEMSLQSYLAFFFFPPYIPPHQMLGLERYYPWDITENQEHCKMAYSKAHTEGVKKKKKKEHRVKTNIGRNEKQTRAPETLW